MSGYVSYETIIAEEALRFVDDNRLLLIDAIADEASFDSNEIRDLDRAWHEAITDRAYSTDDANFIIENSQNVESDRGLWESQEPDEAIKTQAGYTFSADVWTDVEKIYNGLKDAVDEAVTDAGIEDAAEFSLPEGYAKRVFNFDGATVDAVYSDESDFIGAHYRKGETRVWLRPDPENPNNVLADEGSMDTLAEAVALAVVENVGEPSESELRKAIGTIVVAREIASLIAETRPAEVVPGSSEERRLLAEYIRASRNSSRGGYPLGGAYIDRRCGYLYGTDEFAYVRFDDQMRHQTPHLKGMYRNELESYWNRTFEGVKPTTSNQMLEKIARYVRDGAGHRELYDLLPEIETFTQDSDIPEAPPPRI